MKQLLNKLLGRPQLRAKQPGRPTSGSPVSSIYVVSGLPRSGTSMTMKMLEAGGLSVMTDRQRTADDDNPQGYYEYERVKELDKGDTAWIAEAQGQVIKVISALLEYLPPTHNYQVLFIHRNIDEVLASQQKMLHHRAEATDAISDEEMAGLFHKHVHKVLDWVAAQSNFQLLELDYNQLLSDPVPQIRAISAFLDLPLDEQAMAAIVNPELYRNRA